MWGRDEADVAGVLGFAEGLPLRVFGRVEDLGQVATSASSVKLCQPNISGDAAEMKGAWAAAATREIFSSSDMSCGWSPNS